MTMKLTKLAIMAASFVFLTVSNSYAKKMDSNSIEKMIKNNKNTIVQIHASWCPSCRVQKKVLSSIKNPNFTVVEVDFDSQKDFLKKYKIFKQSMLLSFKDGVEVKRVYGITKKEKIISFINESFPSSLQEKMNNRRDHARSNSRVKRLWNY